VGGLRRDSEKRRAVRDAIEPDERPTLFPCIACGGSGRRIIERGKGRYRAGKCPWCMGSGAMDHEMIRAFRRWRRIYEYNIMAGRCPRPAEPG